jgi:hypothetical protein
MLRQRLAGRLKRHSYASLTATLALFVALGGTSYAVLKIDSADVVDNTLRSRDRRNRTIQARDVRRNGLGAGVVKESALGKVSRAAQADRLGGAAEGDLRLKCPTDTVAKAGVCIEGSARPAEGFLGAINRCDQVGRQLPTMPQLDTFVRSNGSLSGAEWTSSVYRNAGNGPNQFDQLEAVLLDGFGGVSYDRVYQPVQHAFRCVALPSN